MYESLNKLLLRCSKWMAAHATLCLLTLMILLGLTVGLWNARLHPSKGDVLFGVATEASATRGSSAPVLCGHVSVAFDPQLSVQQMSRVLRAEDAWIVYGPDALGEYQLRFSSAVPAAEASRSLQAYPEVKQLKANPQCQ